MHHSSVAQGGARIEHVGTQTAAGKFAGRNVKAFAGGLHQGRNGRGRLRWDDGNTISISKQLLDKLTACEHSLVVRPTLAPTTQPLVVLPSGETATETTAIEVTDVITASVLVHEAPITAPRLVNRGAEQGKYEVTVLSWIDVVPEQYRMACPGIPIEALQGYRKPRAHRVEVDVGEQLAHVGFFFDECGFEPVLKKVPAAVMPQIEHCCVCAQPHLHEARQGQIPAAQEQMRMIGHQCPGVKAGARLDDPGGQPIEEQLSVGVGPEYRPSFDATDDHVVEGASEVEAWTTRHTQAI